MNKGALRRITGQLSAGTRWLAVAIIATSVHTVVAQPAPPATTSQTHAKGDLAGDWQATIDMGRPVRTVLRISKTEKGWAAKMILITDQGSQSLNASSVTFDGSSFKYTLDLMGASYDGTVSSDGNTMAGTMTGGPKPQQVSFARATKETAWEIPAPPAPEKLMAADADPSFDVATIKPNNSGGATIQGLTVRGRNFATRNSSLGDLISFSFGVQAKQIVGAPDWIDKDRYDLAAVPDKEGVPNADQLRLMVRKLLADRFKLTVHHEKRDMSAYVLTVGKGGQKLKPTELSGPLPGMAIQPAPGGLMLRMMNSSLGTFTSFLQTMVLDRPVVDQTGIDGKFDYNVTFTPDDSQFNGHAPKLPPPPENVEAAPALFDAVQQQLGLKLAPEKTAVDVIVIDHVEKPSAN